MNTIQACHRRASVVGLVGFSSLAPHWKFSTMKISSAASGTSFASRWLQLCPGEQLLSLRWDYTYWQLNSYPTLLWYRWVFFCLYFSLVFYDVKIYYKYYTLVLSFEYTCLCRCDGFVVACDTVGCLCDNPRGAGGYEIVTMTTLFSVFNNSSTSLRRNCCRFGGVFVAGCIGNCHAGNFHCGRLWKLRRNGDFIGFSFLGITSELFHEFAYWFLNYQPPSIIVLRYHLVFYFTLFYFYVFHFKYCSYEYYS